MANMIEKQQVVDELAGWGERVHMPDVQDYAIDIVDKVLAAVESAGCVVVQRAALISVMDTLAVQANERGELHEGLNELLRAMGVEL